MDFHNLFNAYVFEVKESISSSSTKPPCSGDLENPRSTSGLGGTLGYCRLGLVDFSNFFIPYVFDVNESVFRCFTRPLCSGDLENPSQLPVLLEL